MKASSWILAVPYLIGHDFEGNFLTDSESFNWQLTYERNMKNENGEIRSCKYGYLSKVKTEWVQEGILEQEFLGRQKTL